MSITIEERLRRAAELLDEVAVQPGALDVREPIVEFRREPSPVFARVAAVLLVVVTLAGAAWAVTRGSSSDSNSAATGTTSGASETTAGGATETTAASDTTAVAETTSPAVETTTAGSLTETTAAAEPVPTITLPASADLSTTPVTVAGSTPSQWYRLQPDLDVAWVSPSNGGASQLCFRTPVMEQCKDDTFRPGGYVAVKSAGGHWIILTMDAIDQFVVRFDDGTRAPVTMTQDPQIGYRVGREVGRTPTGASMVFDGS